MQTPVRHIVGRLGIGLALTGAVLFGVGALRMRAAMAPPLRSAPQIPSSSSKQMPQSPVDDVSPGPVTSPDHLEGQRDRMWNDERRKRLVADTDKLLQLATELKVDVDKSSRNELSIKVIQKAAEIEKLSHDVKERMRN